MIPPKVSQLQGALYNWTDDLPLCKHSGIGYQTNLIYRAGGGMGATTEYEDRSFHFQCPGECFLYAILDGHDGHTVAEFAGQRLPAELLLGQIQDENNDEDVKLRLKEAFESVSNGFVEDLINEPLMEKINLEQQLPIDMSPDDANKRFPTLFQHLRQLEKRIKGGCSAVVALIHKSRLFVANVGDTRGLLCRICPNSDEVGVVQLSTDHTIATMSELQRLANLGLDIESLQQTPHVLRTTRSIGDFALKGGYKSHATLKTSREEPILSIPSVHGAEDISDSMKFLVLMSKGVYSAYEQATGVPNDQVNQDIGNMVYEEIRKQTTIEGVAQSVVDKICRLHQEQFIKSHNQKCLRREDMTLLIRLFNVEVGSQDQQQHPLIQQQQDEETALTQTEMSKPPSTIPKQPRLPRPNLTPLKMPEQRKTPSPTTQSRSDTPSSTGSGSTPTTATPGSSGSATTSPQFATPIGGSGNPRSPSPLTVTFTERLQQQSSGQQPPIPLRQPVATHPIPAVRSAFPPPIRPHGKSALPAGVDSTTHASDNKENIDQQENLSVESPSESSFEDKTKIFNRPAEPIDTDEDGRIKAYVSFSEFNAKVLAAGGESVVFAEFLR